MKVSEVAYPISKFEISLYFLFWISHSITAILLAWNASNKVKLWLLLQRYIVPSSYAKGQYMDLTDWEWPMYRAMFARLFFSLAANSIISKLMHRLRLGDTIRSIASIILSFILLCTLASPYCVILILCSATTIILLAALIRLRIFGWIFAIILLLKYPQWAPFITGNDNDAAKRYCEMLLYTYCTLKIINISNLIARNGKKLLGMKMLLEFYEYFLYLPYTMHCVTQFEEFRVQNQQKISVINLDSAIEYWEILKIIVRLTFSFFALETLLHFCFVNSLLNNGTREIFNTFNNYEVASIAYTAGQLFHMKYTFIFGLLNAFAHLDGMIPFQSLICPSRVTKYSQMWRLFDKGLYKFVKIQLYIPLMAQPVPFFVPNGIFRKIFALIAVYIFVLLWHGFQWRYFCWISLTMTELCIERIAFRYIGPSEFWQKNIMKKFSTAGYIRLNSVLLLVTDIPGIFGIFFFLATEGIGACIFQRILIDGFNQIITLNVHLVNAGFVLLHLLLLGYTFNHCCLYIEWRENLQQPEAKINSCKDENN